MLAFLIFRIREGMTHLFSVNDALDVAKAVVFGELMTCLILFSVTRLNGVPRTTPVIHALLLAAALVIVRGGIRMTYNEQAMVTTAPQTRVEHIIVIGSNRLSSLYIGFLRSYAPNRYRVIGSLDDRPEMIGRTLGGTRVLGPIAHLLPIIEEFKEHGILTDRVLIGGDSRILTPEIETEIRHICSQHEIRLDFIPQLIGLDSIRAVETPAQTSQTEIPVFSLPRYFAVKRLVDFILSFVAITLLLPLFLVVAIVVLLDVGSPVFFWQRRLGRNGQIFQMHKFRTLKPSYDVQGAPLDNTERVSWIGAALRKARLDELPQLLNVLVGDMALIGPRPLLPRDQPRNPTIRLSVRPGITGWAQVHGGTLLKPEEKNALDEWYVQNGSLWLDLKILAKTIVIVLTGDRRPPTDPQAEDLEPHAAAQK